MPGMRLTMCLGSLEKEAEGNEVANGDGETERCDDQGAAMRALEQALLLQAEGAAAEAEAALAELAAGDGPVADDAGAALTQTADPI